MASDARQAAILRVGDIPFHWSSRTPEAVAVWEAGETHTFAQFATLIEEGQQLLRSRGVRAGDRVLIIAENCAAEIVLFFAASRLRAWPVILNARMSAREIEVIRSHCRPRITVYTVAISADATGHASGASAVRVDSGFFGSIALSPTDESSDAEQEEWAEGVAALIYTSGTTGDPKGVMVTHRGLLHFCEVSTRSRRMTQSDRVYAVLPLSHIFGIATIVLTSLYVGATLYVAPRFELDALVRTVKAEAITILQGVPLMFRRLLTHASATGSNRQFPALRYLYVGGGGLEPALKREVEAGFGLPLNHGYGMTEYAGSMFVTRMDRPRSDCSSGEINDGCEVRIVADDGRELAAGMAGRIRVRGPGTMLGYYRAPHLTAEVLSSDGWLDTGDVGKLDADGALFVVGRRKDVIKRAGFLVYPVEVEAVLNAHPDVRQSAVVGQPVADGDEEIVAFIELHEHGEADTEQLMAYLAGQLTAYKRPSAIVYVALLPMNTNGKVLKQELRRLLR